MKVTKSLVAAICIGAIAGFGNAAVAADSSDPIKIPIHNWSSQIVGAQIVGKILNEG